MRTRVGRLNDVIHATVIARVLPQILLAGETLTNRPSLGAGNDPSRPYDVETSYRIAEFKISQWKGHDTTRQQFLFADLVNLALDDSGRLAQLFVVGPRPQKFLTTSKASAVGTLGRSSPATRRRFQDRFEPPEGFSVADFTAGPARHIQIIDLATYLPASTLPNDLI